MNIGKSWKIKLTLLVLLLLAFAGVFLWYIWKETGGREDWDGEVIWEKKNIGGFEVQDRLIKNSKYGFFITAPEGWTIKDYDQGGIGIFSPEVNIDNIINSARDKKGCIFGLEINEYKKIKQDISTDVEDLLYQIEKISEDKNILDEENIKYEVIIIDKKQSLKRTFFIGDNEASIEIKVPSKDIIYTLKNSPIFKNDCIYYFDEVINSIHLENL